MEHSSQNKLAMYLAVKAVCDAKPSVWRRSEAFEDAFTDFCACIDNIIHLQSASRIAVEEAVADKILTSDMDELIEQFEAVDVTFVDDYTVARSMDVFGGNIASGSPLPL